jgi:RHS repeat-associated protein
MIIKKLLSGGYIKEYDYIRTPEGLSAIAIKSNGTRSLYYVQTDHLGSIRVVTTASKGIQTRYYYDAWGKQTLASGTGITNRGYIGEEHLNDFGLINLNARLYDPVLARFMGMDPYVQAADFTQAYNRYAYGLNNPLKYIDPSGEIVWFVPVIIGAVIGTYMGGTIANEGQYNPSKWDWSSGKTWSYMAGGAVVGGLAGWAGGAIAGSGIPMANTAAIAGSSLINSIGTWAYTGGQTPISISLGVASYDFTNGTLGYLGKKGNKWYENLGYGLGALANLADVNQLINSTPATLYTDDSDFISHSAIVDNNGDPLMSFGPNDYKTPSTKLGYATYFRKSTSDFHYNPTLPVDITVNKYAIDIVRGLGKILPFQGVTTNCVNMASLSLWLNGIPNIGLHPYLLYATTWAYSTGIRPDLFSYYLTNPYKK